jgi:hypothetical protein
MNTCYCLTTVFYNHCHIKRGKWPSYNNSLAKQTMSHAPWYLMILTRKCAVCKGVWSLTTWINIATSHVAHLWTQHGLIQITLFKCQTITAFLFHLRQRPKVYLTRITFKYHDCAIIQCNIKDISRVLFYCNPAVEGCSVRAKPNM